MHFIRPFALALPALCLVLATATGHARAGIENQETGEQCWGGDCSHMNEGSSQGGGSGGSSSGGLANVETNDCTALETEKIEFAVEWLSENLSAVDARWGATA
jgi:hypothetical protein